MISMIAVKFSFARYNFEMYNDQGCVVARNSMLRYRPLVLKKLGRGSSASSGTAGDGRY
jgi:hypothetical protein